MSQIKIAGGAAAIIIAAAVIYLIIHSGSSAQTNTTTTIQQSTTIVQSITSSASTVSSVVTSQQTTTVSSNSSVVNSTLSPNPELAAWHGNVTTYVDGNYLVVKSNGIPTEAGTFPNANNPNYIEKQNYTFLIPLHPEIGPHTAPIPTGGAIGVALNGVPFFGPYTATGQIAVEVEVFDQCNGHPDMGGQYHYHEYSPCIVNATPAGEHSPLIGFAFDGFPIYGPLGANGIAVTANELDSCNGHYDQEVGSYVYVATNSFPYLLGCYEGTPVMSDLQQTPQ